MFSLRLRRPLRRAFSILGLLAGLSGLAVGPCAEAARAANMFDPEVRWKTIVTPHFRVNFTEDNAEVAHLAAGYAEEAHALLSPFIGTEPAQPTELTLLDHEDTVNGFGFPLPNNQIYIYLSSPGAGEVSGRYESWLRDLLLHEYTHVLHLEKTAGLPAWINGFFGRSYFPDMFQPVFMIEGLAVTTETQFSSGGRGRDATYAAILRQAALQDKLLSIDMASGYYLTTPPAGEAPYVYGMAFYRYLMAHYGEGAPRAIADRYAHYPFFGLYGLDDSLKAVTGKDAATLWAEMQADLKRRAREEEAAIRAQGPLTPLTNVTTGGMYHRQPRFRPDGALVWAEWTGHTYPYLMVKAGDAAPQRVISKGPFGAWGYSTDGRYIYHTRNWDENRFTAYDDLFRWDTEKKQIERLTQRARVSDPGVSPDGRWLVAVQNGHGQSNLVKCRADGSQLKPLTTRSDRAQFSGPVWHPNKHLVAVSAWIDGARDLYLVEPETGALTPLWRNRDVEIDPTWSPDGRYLVFASDRGGVNNLYAYELATRKLVRLTNVLGGLTEPAISPDGKTLAAVSYDTGGYDVVTLPFAPEKGVPVPLPAREPGIRQPLPQPPATLIQPFPMVDYTPWPSFRPKVWAPFAFLDERGPVLGFTTIGQDSLLKHFVYGAFGAGVVSARPFYSIGYSNEEFYPSLYAYASDSSFVTTPQHEGVTYNVPQRALSQGLSVSFPGLPSAFLQNNWVTGDTLTLGLSLSNISRLYPLDPGLPAAKAPAGGQSNALSLTYKYGDNYKFAYSISPEGGNLVTLGYERAMPLLGSQTQYDRVWGDWRRYIALPWSAHHVLALRLSGGVNNGAEAGNFYLGGFDSATVLTNVDLRTASSLGTRQLPLRGYGFGTTVGPKALALSAEYRFPLYAVQRGYGIYPVFVRNVHGAVFAETGQTWKDAFALDRNLVSVGAELRAQTHFVQAPSEVRVGIGQGLTPLGGRTGLPMVFADVGAYF